MSRPLLKESELRQQFKTYFTPEEIAGIQSKAAAAGLPLSTFIREATLGKRLMQIPAANVQQYAELARLAANLNQIAAHLNRQEETLTTSFWREVFFEIQKTRRAADRLRIALTNGADDECL